MEFQKDKGGERGRKDELGRVKEKLLGRNVEEGKRWNGEKEEEEEGWRWRRR